MKIIAYDNFKPGVTLDDLKPYLRDEVSHVWRLWKAGIALEIGIEPTARQAADNGFVSVVIENACGFGDAEARDRSLATLRFVGGTIVTEVGPFCEALRR